MLNAELAGSLDSQTHPGAAASIREGLDETLTVQRLGLTEGAAAYAADDDTSSRTSERLSSLHYSRNDSSAGVVAR